MDLYFDMPVAAPPSPQETATAWHGEVLDCLVISQAEAPHLTQIHTGLSMLARSGRVRVRYAFGDHVWGGRLLSRRDPPLCGLYVLLNQRVLVHYDLRDGAELDERALAVADLYFKRSYSLASTPLAHQHKVLPWGLNYEVHPDVPSAHERQRLLAHKAWSMQFFRSSAQLVSQWSGYPLSYVPELAKMCAPPVPQAPARALFMVRAWDPEQDKDLSPAVRADRHAVNEMRAECVRLLKKTFGERFTGGFAHTDYAIKHYKDVLLSHPEWAKKGRYLDLIKTHPICIATAGLHASVGWKFGEYVAFSKAIVSEQLQFAPPEGFAQGQNYLAFSTPEGCVNATESLMSDAALRTSLMTHNHAYYLQHLKPDRQMWRSLRIASARAG